jgi:toxin ParE1/3/4
MTSHYTLSPRAQSDLDEIWDYTERHGGIDQAETYIRQLWHDILAMAANPHIGRACPEVKTGYYKFRSGSHILFFRLSDGAIDVVRILHGWMDFEQHL